MAELEAEIEGLEEELERQSATACEAMQARASLGALTAEAETLRKEVCCHLQPVVITCACAQ